MTTSTTSIPAVTDALLEKLRAAPDLAETQIVDGQPTQNIVFESDVIVVGYSTERPTAESTQARQNLKADREREEYDLVCLVSARVGDDDPKAARDRCAQILNGFNRVLMEDRRLNGTCLNAQLTVNSWAQTQTPEGPDCTAELLVNITALTKR